MCRVRCRTVGGCTAQVSECAASIAFAFRNCGGRQQTAGKMLFAFKGSSRNSNRFRGTRSARARGFQAALESLAAA